MKAVKKFLKKNYKDIFTVGFLLILTLIFFWPLLLGQIYSAKGFIQADLLVINFPFRYFFGENLQNGIFPFWNPYIGHGFPQFAEGETGMLYPIHFTLHYLLSPITAFNADIILHIFLAGLFTYLFCRQIPKLSRPACLLSSLVFMFGGPMTVHILQTNGMNVIVWLPLELLLIEKLFQKPKFVYFLGLTFVLTMQFLAGFVEIFYYFQVVFGLYILIKTFFSKKRSLLKITLPLILFFAAGVISFLICLPQSSSTYELLKNSIRAKGTGENQTSVILFPIKYLKMYVAPWGFDFYTEYDPQINYRIENHYSYLGLLTLVLVGFGAYSVIKKKSYGVNLLIMAGFLLLVSFNSIFPLYNFLYNLVPLMHFFRMPRFYVLIGFFLAVIAGYGLDFLLEITRKNLDHLNKKAYLIISFITIVLVFVDLYFNNSLKLGPVEAEKWLALPQSAKLLKKDLGQYRIFGNDPQYFAFTDNLEAQYACREFIPDNFNTIWHIPIPAITTGLYLERTSFFGNIRLYITQDPHTLKTEDKYIKKMSLEGIKYIIREKKIDHPELKLLTELSFDTPVHLSETIIEDTKRDYVIKKAYIYENLAVLPRAFITPQFKLNKEKELKKTYSQMLEPDFDLINTVLLEEEPTQKFDSKNVNGKVEIASYTPNEVILETESDNNGWLVLTDTYYPGWKAFVDGQETKIYLANFDFRAIDLPKGQHEIRYIFEPTYWRISWTVSLTTLGLLMIAWMVTKFLIPKKGVK